MKLTPAQNRDIETAWHYIYDTYLVQKRFLPDSVLYGDGSRWPNLSRKEFETIWFIVAKHVQKALQEKIQQENK